MTVTSTRPSPRTLLGLLALTGLAALSADAAAARQVVAVSGKASLPAPSPARPMDSRRFDIESPETERFLFSWRGSNKAVSYVFQVDDDDTFPVVFSRADR